MHGTGELQDSDAQSGLLQSVRLLQQQPHTVIALLSSARGAGLKLFALL